MKKKRNCVLKTLKHIQKSESVFITSPKILWNLLYIMAIFVTVSLRYVVFIFQIHWSGALIHVSIEFWLLPYAHVIHRCYVTSAFDYISNTVSSCKWRRLANGSWYIKVILCASEHICSIVRYCFRSFKQL